MRGTGGSKVLKNTENVTKSGRSIFTLNAFTGQLG